MVTLAVVTFYMWSLRANIATEEARALAFIVLVTANAALILSVRSRAAKSGSKCLPCLQQSQCGCSPEHCRDSRSSPAFPQLREPSSFQPPSVQHSLTALIIGVGAVMLVDSGKACFTQAVSTEPPYFPSRLLFRLMTSTPANTSDDPTICSHEMILAQKHIRHVDGADRPDGAD